MTHVRRLVLDAPEEGVLEVVGSDGIRREYAVRIGADLDVDVMAEILRLAQEFRRYGQNKPEKLAEWAERSKSLIFKVVEQGSPSDEDLAVFKRRAMSPSEAYQILTLLSGNPKGVEAEVAEALTDGVEPREGEPTESDPTTSRSRSRGRSSRSARRAATARPTGEVSDGETSVSNSATSTAA